MAKKLIKYTVIIIICLFVAYNSVYFKKLSEVHAAGNTFNATAYAQNYLDNELMKSLDHISSTDTILNFIKTDTSAAFSKYGHALDIGNVKYFMAKGSGSVMSIDESDIYLKTPANQNIKIATEYVFGNALRDAPGTININDFTNTADLNNISAGVDKIVRDSVLPPFKRQVKKGDEIEYAGAFELNRQHLNTDSIEVIPFYLKIKK
jgi:hypothetical protein